MKKTALQLYSIRELMQKDVAKTLLDTAAAGYTGVEFAGYFDVPADAMRGFLDAAGLVCAGTHTGLPALQPDTIAGTVAYNRTIGNDLIVLPGIPGEMYGSAEACRRTGAMLNDIGAYLRREGMRFYYHNHHREFQVFDGAYALDLMFANADPENLKMELDCYWAAVAGVDLLAYIKKYGSRCSLLHIKDMKKADGKPECTEVGRGVIDYRAILDLGRELGVLWYIVEQENFDIPMLESIAVSAKWLNENL